MRLIPYKFNGTEVNDGTVYSNAKWIWHSAYKGATAQYSERAWSDPKLSGKVFTGRSIKVQFKLGTGTVDTASKLFDKYDRTPRTFICKDAANSDLQWYVKAIATDVDISADVVEVTLAVDEPQEWRTVTALTHTWAITATGQTHAFDPAIGGNRPVQPTFAITPTEARVTDTGYLFCRHVPLYSTSTNHAPDYPTLLTQAGTATVWDHATAVAGSASLANGNDIRVLCDRQEIDYWTANLNSATAKIWANISYEPGQSMTLGVAIGTAAITTITCGTTSANKIAMRALPCQGAYDSSVTPSEYVHLLIDDEVFIAKGNNPNAWQFSGVERAANDTAVATHAAGATIRWIEHDVKIVYGNLSASAPVIDNTKKPIIDLTLSTNASHVFTEFCSADFKRTGGWKPAVTKALGGDTCYYTGSHGVNADPATEMGMGIKAFRIGSKWQAENAVVIWKYYNPFGVTDVANDGSKYRASTDWASGWGVGMRAYNLGAQPIEVKFEATPGSAAGWVDFTNAGTALGATYNNLAAVIQGPVAGVASNLNYLEYHGCTLTLTGYPTVNMSAEKSTYHLDATITNNTSGESISFALPMLLNATFTIDCTNQVAKLSDGRIWPITTSTHRHNWLDCGPAATTLQWDAAGTHAVTVVFSWEDRNL